MKLYYCDHFELPLPPKHRFPMAKYRKLRERVAASGLVRPDQLVEPPPATADQLRLVHDDDYVERVWHGTLSIAEVRRIGFPWSPQMVERSRRSVGATIAAARAALETGTAVNLAGGTHHAFADAGEGFCVFNDVACAARTMQHEGRIERAVVVDCDVHQGNGTASIFQHDSSVFTLSMHGRKNFPLRKIDSDVDVPLEDGTGDNEYLRSLQQVLPDSLDRSRAQLAFFLAGADPYEGDRLGRLGMTKQGLLRRDQIVMRECAVRQIPVVVVMSGGYAEHLPDLVDIHFNTVKTALEHWSAHFDTAQS